MTGVLHKKDNQDFPKKYPSRETGDPLERKIEKLNAEELNILYDKITHEINKIQAHRDKIIIDSDNNNIKSLDAFQMKKRLKNLKQTLEIVIRVMSQRLQEDYPNSTTH
jgi:hypothetical protein